MLAACGLKLLGLIVWNSRVYMMELSVSDFAKNDEGR